LNHVNNRRNRRRVLYGTLGETLRGVRRPHLWRTGTTLTCGEEFAHHKEPEEQDYWADEETGWEASWRPGTLEPKRGREEGEEKPHQEEEGDEPLGPPQAKKSKQEEQGDEPLGPPQASKAKGQYCYWIMMPHPTAQQQAKGARLPKEFTRDGFREEVAKVLKQIGVAAREVAVFREPHASGEIHMNALVWADRQWRWLQAARSFRRELMFVNFGQNVKTWQEGVVYGCVASEHKPPQMIDQQPPHWPETALPLRQCLPTKWQGEGFVRKTRMSNVQFLDLCSEHEVYDEDEIWALAGQQKEGGDRSLEQYLMDTGDVPAVLQKVRKSKGAKEMVRRRALTREEILKEAADAACSCPTPGECYDLMKGALEKNKLDGLFQQRVAEALREGRGKGSCFFTQGPSDSGKSFVLYPLELIFKTYKPPDPAGEPSYPLSKLIGSEIILCNEFEWDKRIVSWAGLKKLFEGEPVMVALPKNGGEDVIWSKDAPVIGSVRHRIAMVTRGVVNEDESEQMDNRVSYMKFWYDLKQAPGGRKKCKPCKACGARLYLEGFSGASGAPPAVPLAPAASSSSPAPGGAAPKDARSVIQELKDLAALKAQGVLSPDEFESLKKKVLEA
jgi:hypothetical protein